MSVPAHDERDYEFAKKYDLDIKIVILPRREGDAADGGPDEPVLPFTESNSLLINSGEYSGMPCQDAIGQDVEIRARRRASASRRSPIA